MCGGFHVGVKPVGWSKRDTKPTIEIGSPNFETPRNQQFSLVPQMGMAQKSNTRGPQGGVLGPIYQGSRLGPRVPIFDPPPNFETPNHSGRTFITSILPGAAASATAPTTATSRRGEQRRMLGGRGRDWLWLKKLVPRFGPFGWTHRPKPA